MTFHPNLKTLDRPSDEHDICPYGYVGYCDLPAVTVCPGRLSKQFFRTKATAGEVRDEVVAAVAGAPRAVATAGTTASVEVTAAEEAAAAPVVPAIIATVAVADLMAAVGDATGGAASGRRAPRRRVTFSRSVRGA